MWGFWVSGIPGLDESYLPRWIGYGFGSLLVLNHFVGSDSATATPAQLVSKPFLCDFLLLEFFVGFVLILSFDFALSLENRSSGPFFGSILHFNSLFRKIS
jgi:hypothetical protein